MQYEKMTDPEDLAPCGAIIKSIDKCWTKVDQEVFISAVILNPFHQGSVFSSCAGLTNASITSLLDKVWHHLFRTDPPSKLHVELRNYLKHENHFKMLQQQCNIEISAAHADVHTQIYHRS